MKLISDEEIKEVIMKADYEDSKVSCPMPITPLRYEKASAQAQLESDLKEHREKVREIQTSLEFAQKIASAMDEIRSSHVFFIIQQAFGDIEWEKAEDILKTVISQAQKYLED